MRYCADTWFIIELFGKNPKALQYIYDAKVGKTRILVPIIVFAEATKKLLQRGISQKLVDEFFSGVEASDKIELVLLDKAISQEAAKISMSFSIPLIDALVAATSKLTGCDALLSGDEDYTLLIKNKYLKRESF